jgi:hypothetical protein
MINGIVMLNLIRRKLRVLASTRVQHQYIRDATKDEYILPEEMLDNAHNAVQLARKSRR